MAIYDQWHKTHPRADDEPCRCGRGRNRLYPTAAHGKGRRWQVRWRDETGQQKRNFADLKGDNPELHAEAFDAKITNEMNEGRYIDPARGKVTLAEYSLRWRRSLIHRDSTEERLDGVFRRHIDPVLGHLSMRDVRPIHLREWVKAKDAALAPSTLSVVYANLASVFVAAVADRVIGVSPCAGVRLPGVERKDHFIPTRDQIHQLAVRLPGRYGAMVYVGAGCGLRAGEIFGLELDAIDFIRREIDVCQQVVATTGKPPRLTPPKTKTSARTVELPASTATALERHLDRYPPVEIEVLDETDPRRPRTRMARMVFPWAGTTGELGTGGDLALIHRASWSHVWRPVADAVGVPPRVGLHCLRHYFATLLIHNGANVKTVQLALGHATPTITLNEYVGEWPDVAERTRSIVDAALGDVPAMCPPVLAAVG